MKTIDAKQCTVIALGRLGENEYTVVRFDVSAWLEEVPGAVIGLYNQRPGDTQAYPVAGITVDGGIASWTVTSAELTQTGEGKCELVAIAGEVVAKSAIFRTIVFDALDGSGEAPEPWEEWQQQLIILKNEAEQAADRAEEAVEHYPRIVDGVWEVWDAQTGAFVSTGVQAQGPKGDPGEIPEIDDALSDVSENPVQNKVITAALGEKADAIHTSAGPASIVSIPDAAAAPVDALTVGIEPVQAGSGDPSPDNVRPITGWTGAKVTRTGKNLCSSEVVHGIWTTMTFYNHDGASSKYLTPRNKIPLVGGRSYVFSFENDPNNAIASGTFIAYRGETAVNEVTFFNVNTGILNVPSGADSIAINLILTNAITRTSEVTTKNYQLELGSTATAYEPYQGETYDIEFPSEAGTVYGGTLDVTKGVLTVDRAMVDMGSMVWNYNTTYAFFTSISISTRKIGVLNVWSDLFKTMAGSWSGTPVQNALWGNGSNATLYVQTPPLDNVNDFMALVDGHQLMYELATPITYTLTPQEIRTLLGTNNIWADTGDVTVGYKADTKLYIDNKITQAIAAALNS